MKKRTDKKSDRKFYNFVDRNREVVKAILENRELVELLKKQVEGRA